MTQPTPSAGLPSPDDPARALVRAERLLACFQQALGHDLPNRLVVIQGLARQVQIEATASLDAETRAGLDHLVQSTQYVLDFVKALAEVGRACRRKEAPVEVDLAELWQEVVAELKWLCPGRPVRYDSVQPLPPLLVPLGNVRRVLVEVLLAAVRRCPAEQPLRLVAAGLQPADSGLVEIRVADDGPVLSPLQQQQAFDLPAGPAVEPATALGPFLARQLVEGWGGSLRIEAGPNRGCVTTFTAPAGREELPT